MSLQNKYEDDTFWRAYATLYWPNLASPDLATFARFVINNLPERGPADPVRILALGFGFGGVELPVIYQIKKNLLPGTKIDCVAIDNAERPLEFAAKLIKNGLEELPLNQAAMLKQFAPFPTKNSTERTKTIATRDGDNFRFILDDLEWEPDLHPVYPQLSNWHERLTNDLGKEYRFDIVIASFCLFHVGMWRHPLLRSLSLLKKDGLFLHPRVEGDESIFEGRPGCRASRNTVAKSIFHDVVFQSDRETESKTSRDTPRGASASRPFVIDEFLCRLESFGLSNITQADQCSYKVAPEVGFETYYDLLDTKGFSTFENLAKKLGDKYDHLLTTIRQLETSATDELEIRFCWTLHKVDHDKLSKEFPLYDRFSQNVSGEANPLVKAYRTEYEMSSALSINPHGTDPGSVLADMGKKLVQQGTLSDSCLAVEFGSVKGGGESRLTWTFLANLFDPDKERQQRQIQQIGLYLALLGLKKKQGGTSTSNTQTLLELVVPNFTKPCILTYQLKAATDYSLAHRSHRDFEEFHFSVPPVSAEDQLSLFDQWTSEFKRKEESQCNAITLNLVTDFDYTDEILGRFVSYLDSTGDSKGIQQRLKDCVKSMESIGLEQSTVIQDSITDMMVFTIRAQQLLSDACHVVFYPATYRVADRTRGKEVVIALYSEVLRDDVLKTEFHKFNQLFGFLRFEHQEQKSHEELMKSHEELMKSHKELEQSNESLEARGRMLKLLQKPLDALSEGFLKVQAEAQEMQSILNEPEEGLFKSHRLLAPMFKENDVVSVSPFIQFSAKHNYNFKGPDNRELLRVAYAYALCRIFGEERALAQAQTVMAVTQMAFSTLKQVRERGVHDEMCKPLAVICGFNNNYIENSVLPLAQESADAMDNRLSIALQNLKAVLFTPFKEFGGDWPLLPVKLAAYGVTRFSDHGEDTARSPSENTHKLRAVNTPIAQHAVLTFLVGMRNELATVAAYTAEIDAISCNFVDSGEFAGDLEEYTLTLKLKQQTTSPPPLFFRDLEKAHETLQEFIKVCLRHRLEGENVGSFHGVFHRLLRHAMNSVSLGGKLQSAEKGRWCYLPPPAPTSVDDDILLLRMGKVKDGIVLVNELENSQSLPLHKFSRYFFIVQTKLSNQKAVIRLIWSDCSDKWLRSNQKFSQLDQLNTPAPLPNHEVAKNQNGNLLQVFIVDHNRAEPWLTAFNRLLAWCRSNECTPPPSVSQWPHDSHKTFNPTSECLVVLHTNENEASYWTNHLMKLQVVRCVFIVSAEGDPRSKGITENNKIEILDVKASDIQNSTTNHAASLCYAALCKASGVS